MLIRVQRAASTAESTNCRRHASLSNLRSIVLTRVRLSNSDLPYSQSGDRGYCPKGQFTRSRSPVTMLV